MMATRQSRSTERGRKSSQTGEAEDYTTLEALLQDFAQGFKKKGSTDLNNKTIAAFFAKELARRIREYAIVRKRPDPDEGDG